MKKVFVVVQALAVITAIVSSLASRANAVPVTFSYQGVISRSDAFGGADVTAFAAFLGQTIKAQFTFESDPALNPDQVPSSTSVGRYEVSSFSAELGNLHYSSTAPYRLRVEDNGRFGTQNLDLYQVAPYSSSSAQVSGQEIGGVSPSSIVFNRLQFVGQFFNCTSRWFFAVDSAGSR